MQQALLRVIEAKEVQPIGGRTKKIDIRIISATNRNLFEMCREGKFRWDLYYRLVVSELILPDLLERGTDDIREMINFFIEKKQSEMKKDRPITLTHDTYQLLLNYPWPGNIRELENLIENLYAYCSDIVTPENLPERFIQIPVDDSLRWEDVEKKHIERVLTLKKGNKRQAFLALGYGAYNTFSSRLKKYGLFDEG